VLKQVTNSINHLSHQQQQVREQNERVAKAFSKEVTKKADLRHYNEIAQLRQNVINERFNRLEDSSKHDSIQLHNIGGAIEPQIYTIESNTASANNRIEHIESCLGRLVDVQASTDKSLKDYIEHQQRTNSRAFQQHNILHRDVHQLEGQLHRMYHEVQHLTQLLNLVTSGFRAPTSSFNREARNNSGPYTRGATARGRGGF
jgi:nucleotidyltransferase/DNA polymerase involved in DNA repair